MAKPVPDLTAELAGVSQPGEHLLASTWANVQPPAARVGRYLGIIGAYTISRPIGRRAALAVSSASRVPLDVGMVLALTNRRLLVWSGNVFYGKLGAFLGDVPRSRLTGMEAVADGRQQSLRLVLADAPAVTVGTPTDPEDLVAAFSSPAGA